MGPFGLLGDRRFAVVDDSGEPMSARRSHALLGFRAVYGEHEAAEDLRVATPAGAEDLAWDDPALATELATTLQREVRLARGSAGVHDAAPIHLISTGSLAGVSDWVDGEEVDRRRFRANLIVEMNDTRPFAEAAWVGASIAIGDGGPVLQVVSPTERCAVTTFDPDTLARDNRVLAGLARETENLFGVYALVARSGWVEVGDPIRMA